MASDPALDQAIIIALGSNLAGGFESCEALLEAALERLASRAIIVARRSSIWRSKAWPDPAAPSFVNVVAMVATPLPPRSLLAALLGLEAGFGRFRRARNDPRSLDLDLIAYGRQRIDVPGLVLPHPYAADRRFVMGPLAEIAPDWRHPVTGETAAELAQVASVGRDAHIASA